MATILIGTDVKKDPFIQDVVPRILNDIGYDYELIYPLQRIPDTLRVISSTAGGIHAILIVHSGSMTSGITNPIRVAERIRSFDDKFSIDGIVKAKSLPILIIQDSSKVSLNEVDTKNIKWCHSYDPLHGRDTIQNALFAIQNEWRKDLLHELECVGYAISIDESGELSVEPTFVRSNIEGEILAPKATLNKIRASRFLILSSDFISEAEPYLELTNLLNNYKSISKKSRTKPEELFQKFFERNPSMIMRDLFVQHWARPRLRLPENSEKYIEPDFVLKPRFGANLGTKWQILDIKLPEVKLTSGGKFHPGFSSKLLRATKQLRDYRKYFNRLDIEKELDQRFGFHPKNPKLAVLIGNSPYQEETEAIAEFQGDYNMLDIEIITYDEILESRSRILETHMAWLESIK